MGSNDAIRSRLVLVGLLLASACADGPESIDPASIARAPAPTPVNAAPVFDPSWVHQIELEVAPEHLARLDEEKEERVPARVTVDGQTIEMAGIRKKWGYGSASPLDEKPSFSIKFNTFVMEQELEGL